MILAVDLGSSQLKLLAMDGLGNTKKVCTCLLYTSIHRIKKQGVSVIVISHRMDDIFTCCDRVIVLKDGMFVFSAMTKNTNNDEIISKMVGREFKNVYPPRNDKPVSYTHLDGYKRQRS